MPHGAGRFNEPVDAFVARFTASVDFDQRLAQQDIQGSIAHAKMLMNVGVLSSDELNQIIQGLEAIEVEINQGAVLLGHKPLKMFI